MPFVKSIVASFMTLLALLPRLVGVIARYWADVRAFLDGLRIAWVPTASVLLAFWLFTSAPQAQDLFLEVRGSLKVGSLFWLGFYAGIILVWVLPVYVCAHWILYRVRNEGLSPYEGVTVEDWVCRSVPRVLAAACLAAVFAGQVYALYNAPNIFGEEGLARMEELAKQAQGICRPEDGQQMSDLQSVLCHIGHTKEIAQSTLKDLERFRGAEYVILILYAVLLGLPGFFLLVYGLIRMSESASRRVRMAFVAIAIWPIAAPFLVKYWPIGWILPDTWLWSWLYAILRLIALPSTEPLLGLALFLSLPPAVLRRIPTRWRPLKWLRYAALGVWWILIGLIALLIAAALVAAIYGLVLNELHEPLGVGHLGLLPTITVLVGWLVWWALGSPPRGGPTRVERLLPWRIGTGSEAALFDQARAKAGAWNPLFWAVLAVSLVLLAYQLSLHPVDVTRHVYRALMVPFFLGLLVPLLTFISHFSFRVHAPITALTILTIAIVIGMRSWVHDVRPAKREALRPTLEETVQRWADVNDCDPMSTSGDRLCPQPIIVSAAGGASRAAFLVGAVIGRLMDETHDAAGNEMRPFAKQLFAMSGVSGGALGAAVTYAALADTQLEPTAINGKSAPPCTRDVHDTEWFRSSGRQQHAKWRDCLEIILAGDFLSPVFVGLISNDIFGAPFRDDRAGILEHAWERRYANLTEQRIDDKDNPTTLDRAMVDLRRHVLDADPSNWLPMLLLNGTSVTTGRRIVASDVDTLYTSLSTQQLAPRGRLFRDAYDLHDLFQASTSRDSFDEVAVSARGNTVAMIDAGSVRLWDLETQRERPALQFPDQASPWKLAALPDGRTVLVVDYGSASIWDVATGTLLRTLQMEDAQQFEVSPDGTRALAAHWRGAQVFDAASGAELCKFELPSDSNSDMTAALSPDGRQVLVRGESGKLELRDATTCAHIQTFETSDLSFMRNGIAISPDGRYVMTVANYSSEVVVWDAATGAQLFKRGPEKEYEVIEQVAFSPDGKHFLGQNSDRTLVWRVEDGEKLHEFERGERDKRFSADFSPDGTRLLVMSGNAVHLVETGSWAPVRTIRAQESEILGASFYADGAGVVTWDDTGVVHLWDTEHGAEVGIVRPSLSAHDRCSTCDVRLSTAVTMSARFPVISPPGNIRNSDGKTIDRIVDGGYYENFGAISALELAEVLRNRYELRPAIILINNEPAILGMSCISPDSRLAYPEAPTSLSFATFRSSIEAMMATRSARGTLAAVELCQRVTADNFAFVSVDKDPTNPKKALTMSWWLSKHVQKYLDDQVSPTAKTLNQQAFQKIRSWRSH